jgi:hypothetical protein
VWGSELTATRHGTHLPFSPNFVRVDPERFSDFVRIGLEIEEDQGNADLSDLFLKKWI